MSAEIVKFPTRRRKAFRMDWEEAGVIPHNLYPLDCSLFRCSKGMVAWCKERAASPDASELEIEVSRDLAASWARTLARFGYSGDAA